MAGRPDVHKSNSELLNELNDVVSTLRVLCEAYEKGQDGVASTIAVQLQTLVYDKGKTRSLLYLLKRKNLSYFGTPNPLSGSRADLQYPLIRIYGSGGRMAPEASLSLGVGYRPVYWSFHGCDGHLRPKDRIPPWRRMPFQDWWNEKILKVRNHALTRESIVLMARNVFSGAHCSHVMSEAQAAIHRDGITDAKVTIEGKSIELDKRGMERACVRQIAYELQKTLDHELNDLLRQPATVPPKLEEQGQLKVMLNRDHLHETLRSFEESGEGDFDTAEHIRSQIYWHSR